jgi:hypothetical protein
VKGKILVVTILLAGLAMAGGTMVYWRRAKEEAIRSLADDERRAGAFVALLRANRLRGHARERSHDGRAASPGRAYVAARDPGGGTLLHLVRAAVPAPGGGTRCAIYAFREDGGLAGLFEDSEAHEVDAGGGGRLAAIIAPAPGAPGWMSVRAVTGGMEEALRIRGEFRLETTAGLVAPRAPRGEPARGDTGAAPAPDAPTFRYDPESGRFRGPPGGPGERWEVDPARSPRWMP